MTALICNATVELDASMQPARDKQRAASKLLEQLTTFGESIAGDASGDGEFDLEVTQSLHLSRACLLRWIAVNSQDEASPSCARILFERQQIQLD